MSVIKVEHNSSTVKRVAWINEDVENNSKTRNIQKMQELDTFLRKLQLSMSIFGIVFVQREPTESDKSDKMPSIPATLYNCIVLICMWATVLKNMVSIFLSKPNSDDTIMHIVIIIWSFEVTMNASVMLKSSHPKFGHSNKACGLWKEIVLPLLDEMELDMNVSQIKKHLIKVTIIGWIVILCNVFLLGFIYFYPYTSYYEKLPTIFLAPLPVNIYTKVFAMVISIFYSCAWIFPVLHTAALSTILKVTFKACRKALEKANKTKSERNVYPGCLFRERNLHLSICKIVAIFDRDLKFLYANVCSTHIALASFLLYHMFKSPMDTFSMISYVFWMSSSLAILAVTCSYAASMNKAAHSPLDVMYETGTTGMTLEQIGQVNFYLSKLTAAPIGFTVLDFFVITREFILTIGGIFLTYSFVLLQF